MWGQCWRLPTNSHSEFPEQNPRVICIKLTISRNESTCTLVDFMIIKFGTTMASHRERCCKRWIPKTNYWTMVNWMSWMEDWRDRIRQIVMRLVAQLRTRPILASVLFILTEQTEIFSRLYWRMDETRKTGTIWLHLQCRKWIAVVGCFWEMVRWMIFTCWTVARIVQCHRKNISPLMHRPIVNCRGSATNAALNIQTRWPNSATNAAANVSAPSLRAPIYCTHFAIIIIFIFLLIFHWFINKSVDQKKRKSRLSLWFLTKRELILMFNQSSHQLRIRQPFWATVQRFTFRFLHWRFLNFRTVFVVFLEQVTLKGNIGYGRSWCDSSIFRAHLNFI